MIVGLSVSGNRIFHNLYTLRESILLTAGGCSPGLEGKDPELPRTLIASKSLSRKRQIHCNRQVSS